MQARQQMTLGLLAAAIVLVGYAYFVESKREIKGETTDVEVWSVSEASAVALKTFEIQVDGKAVLYTHDGDKWRLSTEPKRELDVATFNAGYSNFRNLMATRKVQDGTVDLGKYGLDKPSIVLTLGDAKSPFRLEVGQKNAIGDAYYAHSLKDDAVYAVAGFRVDGWRALGATPPLVALPAPSASPSASPTVAPLRRFTATPAPKATPVATVAPTSTPAPKATASAVPTATPAPSAVPSATAS